MEEIKILQDWLRRIDNPNYKSLRQGVKFLKVKTEVYNYIKSKDTVFLRNEGILSSEFNTIITDDDDNTQTQDITITVNAVDDSTVITAGTSGSGDEDGVAITGQITAFDVEGLTNTSPYSISIDSTNGTASIGSDGSWSYTPVGNFNGTDAFTVTITDDDGNNQTQGITLTINPTDDPLVISGDLSGSGKDSDGIISGTIIATDLADGLTNHNPYSVTTAALNGTAEITSGGAWNYTPNQAFNGNDSFTVTITDDDGHTLDQVIQISVSPSIVLHSGLSYEETTPSIVGTADAGTIIKLIYNETVVGTSKTDNNGYFSIIPSVNLLEGDNLITITSSDSENNLLSSIEHTLSIQIRDAELNLPTIIGPDDSLITIYENSKFVNSFSSNKDVNWSLSGIDSNLFEISNNGALSFVNSPDYEIPAGGENDDSNAYSLTINASDHDNNRVSSDLIISVLDREDTPSIISEISSDDFDITDEDSPNVIVDIPVEIENENFEISIEGGKIKDDTSLIIKTVSETAADNAKDLGITINDKSIAYEVETTNEFISTLLGLDLVGSDFNLESNNNEQVDNLKLSFLSIDENENVIDNSYDPITGYGALFYDLHDNDGIADTLKVITNDGGTGDNDDVINSFIDENSTSGYSILDTKFEGEISSTILKYTDSDHSSVTANSNLIAILDQNTLTSTSDEIGYIALNPGENFDELTYDQFMDRYRVLYHTLENTDVNYGSDPSALFKREIVIGNDQSLILYKITDGSTNELTSLEDNKLSLLSSNSIANETAKLISTDNLVIDLTPTDSAFGIEQFICKEQSRAPIFDFRNLENFQITARLEVSREANYDTTLGFYKILDAEGTFLDPVTGSIISTSSDAYHDVALNDSNKVNFGPTHSESTFYVDDDVDAFFDIDMKAKYGPRMRLTKSPPAKRAHSHSLPMAAFREPNNRGSSGSLSGIFQIRKPVMMNKIPDTPRKIRYQILGLSIVCERIASVNLASISLSSQKCSKINTT